MTKQFEVWKCPQCDGFGMLDCPDHGPNCSEHQPVCPSCEHIEGLIEEVIETSIGWMEDYMSYSSSSHPTVKASNKKSEEARCKLRAALGLEDR